MLERTPSQLQYGFIKPDEVVRIYKQIEEEIGICSLGRVQDYYKRKGILNPATRKPPTRYGILCALKKTPEGREILRNASHMRYLKRPKTGWPEERWARDQKRKEINVPAV